MSFAVVLSCWNSDEGIGKEEEEKEKKKMRKRNELREKETENKRAVRGRLIILS